MDGGKADIAFVGAGPTTLYTLHALLEHGGAPRRIVIYEEQARAGLGMPYRPGWNDPAMLSNIASIEIPPVTETLVAWLQRQPRADLIRLGVDPDAIDDRAFYPRIALGEYFRDQFAALVTHARARGILVEIAIRTRVVDIAPAADGLMVAVEPAGGAPFARTFAHVVIATGHRWPDEPEVRPGYFSSPWPATALHRIPATRVGIRGSSLTAIDAAVALAMIHGSFVADADGVLRYVAAPGGNGLHLVMMSRKGLLPEADFYHPVPYEPLAICTPAAMRRLIATARADLLDRAFALFRQELAHADPAYAARVALHDATIEDFADRYFAARLAADPFAWAITNLAEARANQVRRRTVPWRYAILRLHEVLAMIVPHLSEAALDRFDRHLRPVFVDEYATVPHASIERLLALHAAGRLDVVAVSDTYLVDTAGADNGAIVVSGRERRHFPIYIDATGQQPLPIEDFPFETLVAAGVVRAESGNDDGPPGIAVDARFHPLSDHPAADRLHCLGLPFILERHPFIQGITSARDLGEVVGAELAAGFPRTG